MGFGGVALLVVGTGAPLGAAGLAGPAALVAAGAAWALGSVYSKRRPVTTGPYIHAALQMLFGGGVLAVIGISLGEAGRLEPSMAGVGAVLYLIAFGSIVAYTSYVYLLQHAQAAFIGTSTYVNTVVAVLLGWVILDEHLTLGTLLAIAVVLGSVLWVRRAMPERR
ncbi:MAG: EamA family transporter [Gemmatimonadales bacterium]